MDEQKRYEKVSGDVSENHWSRWENTDDENGKTCIESTWRTIFTVLSLFGIFLWIEKCSL